MRASLNLGAVLLAVVCLGAAQVALADRCERLIVSGSPDAPPYLWRDPQDPRHLMGANADLLKQAVQELGISVEFLYAGKRSQALEEVRSGRMDLLADAASGGASAQAFDFIEPPVSHNEIVVWTRSAVEPDVTTLEELAARTGARSQRTRFTPGFDAQTAPRLQLQSVSSLTQALQKLMLGEVDYVLAGRYSAMVMAQTLGLSAEVKAMPMVVDRPAFHLALSTNSVCNDPLLRGQLEKKMTESAASGRADEAVKRNLDVWKSQLQQPAANQ
ncbi:transporter substrate-binding domain-containing protein [Pseudomonas sp. DTU_2021_1001937_2_SI_NGA_ILE_001]|uniref:substrate-binding periplasmic protein n=1 Tax=Pseudomonas sp. DTU_2021_1001937_2_SI_NGA_ILE_001 TaxID=3077589 RepID=UPI0028FC0D8B|nr:transporter substrate-binding domain-containing protein [Pseudomonas sp. DTU_2021_1001937_2_SI_NGA_ILE_001]WNW10809.1 transporter substrate-binding domain-containing protein [Pseudomonas sp. DTU_2021_1001937_2_SI_NGA_ILE_001]